MQWNDRIGRRLRLHDLHILMVVAETGSMRKAAERLNITQPAVSRSIAELEHTAGVRLLDRSRQGVEPTLHGRALLDCGTAVFEDLRQGVKTLEFLSDPTAGELRIGSSPALAEGIVLTVVERLTRQYPRLVFHVAPSGAIALQAQLRERRFELAFMRTAGILAENELSSEVLFEDQLAIAVGRQNPILRRRKIALADLIDEPWTWPSPESEFSSAIVDAFRGSGLAPPRGVVHTNAINMRTGLAAAGRFLAVVPAYILKSPNQRTLLKPLPVELPGTQAHVGIVTVKNRTLSPLAQLVIKTAREIAKSIVGKPQIHKMPR
jgi:DNA-binding transcriptional LysR family regulator